MGGPPPGSDAYGQPRRWPVIVGAGVLLAVGLVGGAVLGRQAWPVLSPTPTPGQSVTAGVPGVGPTRLAAGVPIGYDHSAIGAAQAAGNYLAALGQLDSTRAKAALDQVAEPSSRVRLEQGQASSLQVTEGLYGIQSAASQGKRVLLTQTPIAYKVETYTPEEATIRVWLVTCVGVENRQRLAAFYAISGVTLAWLDGDWRLRSIDGGSQAGDVVPASLQTPTQTGGVPANLDGFVPYGSS